MAKDKNHSSKNQNHKNHQNGIKKPQRQKYGSLKGSTKSSSETEEDVFAMILTSRDPKQLKKEFKPTKLRTHDDCTQPII
jgi:hypothetical protein